MRKKIMKLLITCAMVAIFAEASLAADVVLTSFGQSPDVMMAKVVLRKINVDGQLEKLLYAENLGDEKVLITVVGGSSKGLGEAGIDKDEEIARVNGLISKAKSKGTKVLVMHIGGKGRRGKLSDLFIQEALPKADKVIVVKGGDHDGLFSSILKGTNIEMIPAESVRATTDPLKKILTEWEVIK